MLVREQQRVRLRLDTKTSSAAERVVRQSGPGGGGGVEEKTGVSRGVGGEKGGEDYWRLDVERRAESDGTQDGAGRRSLT